MKRMVSRLLLLFAAITLGVWLYHPAHAQTDGARVLTGSAQPPLPFNILPNAGFEDRTTGWSVTGGTFTTISTPASNVARGTRSGSWTVPASVTGYILQSNAITIPAGLFARSCAGSILYKGNATTNGTLTIEAYDGTTTYGSKVLANASTYTLLRTDTFTCPSTGTLRLRVRMTTNAPSAPTAVYFDEAYLGDLESSGSAGGGSFDVSTGVTVAAAGTVSMGSEIRKIIYLASTSGAVTLDATTPLSAGTTAGYERVLIGSSDTDTVTIGASGNVNQNGPMTLTNGSSIWYIWDDANSKWIETGRKQ